jgi:hypothetical protein
LPLPLGAADRDGGYWWECSMRQVEVSRTMVVDAPRHARGFFEALTADNLDLGRPANVEITFGRKIRRDTAATFRTAIDRRDMKGVVVNVFYKNSWIKQYLKDGRAMRIETVVNAPETWAATPGCPTSTSCRRALVHATAGSWMLNGSARAVPLRVQPLSGSRTTVDAEGRRTPGASVRRSSGHGPGRRLVHHRARRDRLYQQAPARLGGRPARRALPPGADDLRPAPAATPRADPAPAPNQSVCAHA